VLEIGRSESISQLFQLHQDCFSIVGLCPFKNLLHLQHHIKQQTPIKNSTIPAFLLKFHASSFLKQVHSKQEAQDGPNDSVKENFNNRKKEQGANTSHTTTS
jgi:hypothetical protein